MPRQIDFDYWVEYLYKLSEPTFHQREMLEYIELHSNIENLFPYQFVETIDFNKGILTIVDLSETDQAEYHEISYDAHIISHSFGYFQDFHQKLSEVKL